VLALFLAFIAVLLGRQWGQVRPLLGQLSLLSVAMAAVAVLGGIFAAFLSWRAVLADLGAPLPLAGAMRVFFLGQLGKYLPGSIWPALAQMELGRDYRVPQRTSGAAVMVTLLLAVGVGLAVAIPTLPLLGPDAIERYWWTLAVLPVAIVVATPPVLNRLIGIALRLARRPPLPTPLSLRGILWGTGWSLVSWLLYGVHIWVLARQLGATGGLLLLVQSTGAFAGAWCIGFLLVVAPAGAGAREATLILLLSSVLSAPQATVVSIVSRLLSILGDLAWGGAAVLAERRRRPDSAPAAVPDAQRQRR
jgi:glycosyltransferase 2 family protein